MAKWPPFRLVVVRVRVYGRCGRPWARESRPEVLPRDGYRSRASGGPSGRSVVKYGIPKVGRSAASHRVGRCGTVECNGIVTGISVTLNLKFKVTKSFVTTLPFI